ncbi:MAG: hypothetical protein M5U22_07095 [Thermoleophilia bacterium]|nr:hypothetical protein [Thermoleophilia bacterium]
MRGKRDADWRPSVHDLAVLAACLALASYAVPMLITVWGGNLHPLYLVLWTILVLLPGGLAVFAAWQRILIGVWLVAVAFFAVWLLGWQRAPILIGVAIFYPATAILTTIARVTEAR